jgi:hypothetical protein
MGGLELNQFGSDHSCEHGNELSGSIRRKKFYTALVVWLFASQKALYCTELAVCVIQCVLIIWSGPYNVISFSTVDTYLYLTNFWTYEISEWEITHSKEPL